MFLSPGFLVCMLGVCMVTLATALFRKPGVRFFSIMPIWRAGEFVKLPGVVLWGAALVVSWVGAIMFFARIGV